MDPAQIAALVLPIVAIQIALIILALRGLTRPDRRVRGGSKLLWGLVIVLLELVGPALYFLVGRESE